ncbi:acetylornithine aminotransferase [Alicyclobacillus cellulosilyticus]|uniref:Acetylornithine aminotransferase n=1 Tax=Alicyclobacillus cellulosilyticus TaxID=1003997 RepID=A0A917NII2_9BACL|nr:acetylornithine transaminase [Alicyclobacillus cellulosilyticus]GGJ03215.1 acetylornithine aminotransferase [Alicyclobacillus cellulosilyticus]
MTTPVDQVSALAGAQGSADWPLMDNYGARSRTMVRGEGVYLFDAEGKQYLDFTAGIAVCALGHSHPELARAVAEQAHTLIHCSNLYLIPQQVELARKLTALSGLDKAFFCNSGAEANEAAIKLARRYAWSRGETKRTRIVSLPGGFHGRTLGALSITPKPAYQEGFHPLIPDCFTPESLSAVVDAIDERTAACVVEVIQGEGGVRPVPQDLLRDIAARCREQGALLIVDEVQTGVGRTGTFFAFEQVGLKPDIVALAKGLAGGVPAGAVLARAEIAQALTPGSHGSTFGGNPLAMAAGNVVVDIVRQPAFLAHVRQVGAYLASRLRPLVAELTGAGLMWGFSVPDARAFVARAAEAGVLLTAIGEHRVRMVPPLILEEAHVDEMVARLQRAGLL